MKILVVAATHAEISGLYAQFNLPQESFVQTPQFDILITGVGMTATAFALGRRLNNDYSLILNLGIAGCYNRNIPLGTLLNITEDELSELGAENKDEFLSIAQLGFGKGHFSSNYSAEAKSIAGLTKVRGITVNKVHGNTDSINEIINRLNPSTESMEGAAVFYCAEQSGIPAVQIRSISNYVEERNRSNWQIGLAVKNLNQWAIEFLTQQ